MDGASYDGATGVLVSMTRIIRSERPLVKGKQQILRLRTPLLTNFCHINKIEGKNAPQPPHIDPSRAYFPPEGASVFPKNAENASEFLENGPPRHSGVIPYTPKGWDKPR